MTDIPNDSGLTTAIDNQGAPAAGGEPDFKALYERERRDRISERNLTKARAQILEGLDEESVAAIARLTAMARNGDGDGVLDWAIETGTNISQQRGQSLADIVAARQGANNGLPSQQQPVPQASPSLTADDIARIVNEQTTKQVSQQVSILEHQRQIAAELKAAGYEVGSDPEAATIIHHAAQNGIPVGESIKWYDGVLRTRLAKFQQGAQQTAAQTPQLSPTGSPASSMPDNATPSEKAYARLTRGNLGQ